MDGSEASDRIDWAHQAQQLRAHVDESEAEQPLETLFGFAGEAGEVSWQEDPRATAPCVAVLRRYGRKEGPAVLIVPGATAWRGTFFTPRGGLIDQRLRARFDVWTLDWRGTKVVTDLWRDQPRQGVPDAIAEMDLCQIADGELSAAAARIRATRGGQNPALLGHCIGGGVVALAIARGRLRAEVNQAGRGRVLLSTLGLFYRGAVDTWFRANERIDLDLAPEAWSLDYTADDGRPAARWPALYEQFYGLWSKTPYPHCESRFCRRMSAIIGAPYRPDDIGYLHDDEHAGLRAQFGLLPLSLLDHIGRAVRQGLIEEHHARTGTLAENLGAWDWTLFTGSENQLWHRDSIDRMQEWLGRVGGLSVCKRIFDPYGHQDLWWSPRAADHGSVYDFVVSRLLGKDCDATGEPIVVS